MKQYNLVLLNDDTHSYRYVVTLLQQLFDYSEELAFKLTTQVDKFGRAVVYTGPYEHAEFKRDQILKCGPDPDMDASSESMNCELEPV